MVSSARHQIYASPKSATFSLSAIPSTYAPVSADRASALQKEGRGYMRLAGSGQGHCIEVAPVGDSMAGRGFMRLAGSGQGHCIEVAPAGDSMAGRGFMRLAGSGQNHCIEVAPAGGVRL